MSFEVQGLEKHFGTYKALDGVSLRVARGELLALLGPSGCGKTTLLRVLAGLEAPDEGKVLFEGEDVTRTPAAARNVGLVFQHYALFDHMTVFENVAFGLRVRGTPRVRVAERVQELLHHVRLEGFAQRPPSQLSGGQRQRVALARALAAEPRVLLLDEPFGALDARVRQDLRVWLRRLHADTKVTTVLVTHDREDAFEVADRVAVMNAGRLEQVGPPTEVFHEPASAWVMRFLGDVNEFPIESERGSVVGYVRPHEIELSRSLPRSGATPGSTRGPSSSPSSNLDVAALSARVRRVQPAGASVRVEFDAAAAQGPLVAELDERRFHELALQTGDAVFLSPRRVRVFDGVAR